jgi:hypothetical protein
MQTFEFSGKLEMPDNLKYEYIVGNYNLSNLLKMAYEQSRTQIIEIVLIGQMGEFLNESGVLYEVKDKYIKCLHVNGVSIDSRLFNHTDELVDVKIIADIEGDIDYGKIYINQK